MRPPSWWALIEVFCYVVKDRPEISSPVDFEHTVHVGFNQNTGEFTVSLVEVPEVCIFENSGFLVLGYARGMGKAPVTFWNQCC